ncbi:hypothetical protein BVI434_1950013 [Burkholderia vietnamiensis]|nr:hypothetical protein BVI434_1950013 [Burkholderia vietnamiensis]
MCRLRAGRAGRRRAAGRTGQRILSARPGEERQLLMARSPLPKRAFFRPRPGRHDGSAACGRGAIGPRSDARHAHSAIISKRSPEQFNVPTFSRADTLPQRRDRTSHIVRSLRSIP